MSPLAVAPARPGCASGVIGLVATQAARLISAAARSTLFVLAAMDLVVKGMGRPRLFGCHFIVKAAASLSGPRHPRRQGLLDAGLRALAAAVPG